MKRLSETDLQRIKAHGIDEDTVYRQQELAIDGVPEPKVLRTAAMEDGIISFDKVQQDNYEKIWQTYLEKGNTVSHFIPASGKANRFFRDLYSFLNSDNSKPQTNFEKNFFRHLANFAFFEDLDNCCIEKTGDNVQTLILKGKFKLIVELLLTEKGLNYGALPSSMFKFHTDKPGSIFSVKRYLPKKIVNYYSSFEEARTPIQECMIECAMVSGVKNGSVKVYFSVSEESLKIIREFIHEFRYPVEKKFKISMPVSLPCQVHSSDAVVFKSDGSLYHDKDGNPVFLPGGHGTLLGEFSSVGTDVVFIKNIDNVELDSEKKLCAHHKKVLAGFLLSTQKTIAKYLRLLDKGKDDIQNDKLIEIINFVENTLNVKNDNVLSLGKDELVKYLYDKLNRPIRVCGMVRNEYEQGGMPCWVKNADGTTSLQIIEYYQINNNPDIVKMFKMSTHFNPVDVVCYISDYKGKKFELGDFVDNKASIVYAKCLDGQNVKFVEQPGLWNGCMAYWNTLFVDVPIKTFNPVKTINDLLRYEHQK